MSPMIYYDNYDASSCGLSAVIPNVVDPDIFRQSPKRDDRQTKQLLYVGNFKPLKNVSILVEALGRMNQRWQDWHLDLVGDGSERARCELLASNLGIADKMTFHGMIQKGEIAALMLEADFFVHPSGWENLPCVLLEALTTGTPVVATNVGGVPEIVEDGLGLMVPPNDIGALAAGIAEMLPNPAQSEPSAIRERSRRYWPDAVADTLQDAYLTALRERSTDQRAGYEK